MKKYIGYLLLPILLTGCMSNGYKNYGSTHGLGVAGAMIATNEITKRIAPDKPKLAKTLSVIAGVGLSGYFYERERKARKGAPFKEWYTDSQMDAVTPMLVTGGLWKWYLN